MDDVDMRTAFADLWESAVSTKDILNQKVAECLLWLAGPKDRSGDDEALAMVLALSQFAGEAEGTCRRIGVLALDEEWNAACVAMREFLSVVYGFELGWQKWEALHG